MEALKVENLSKNFGGLQVLKNVSFHISVGERLAIIGPNGAGKTTLINLIAGELTPTTGKIYLSGREISSMLTHQRVNLGLARSYQIVQLLRDLSVLENIRLAILGTKPFKLEMFRPLANYNDLLVEAHKLLDAVDMWEIRDKRIKNLSHADQRKMEIAVTIASKPKLLLLDEPSAGLAIAEIPKFVNLVRNFAEDTTVFFVAHDMDVVFELASRVLVLFYGEIMAAGTPKEIQANSKVREIYLGEESKV